MYWGKHLANLANYSQQQSINQLIQNNNSSNKPKYLLVLDAQKENKRNRGRSRRILPERNKM